jgi:hypothetical protein
MGFSSFSEWVDYRRPQIEAIEIDVAKGLVVLRATKDEYARAAEITQAGRWLSR